MTIRLATAADAAGVRTIYAPFVRDTHVSFETEVPSEADVAGRITSGQPLYPWIVAEAEAGVVGYAYAGPHRSRGGYQWSAETSVYVAEGHRRRGLARALTEALLDVLWLQGFANAYAGVALPNAASVAFHEALGFAPVGVYERVGFKAGAWHDVGWWALRLGDGTAPDPPKPLAEVAEAVGARLLGAGRLLEG